MGRSLITQMSSGSPSPRSAPGESFATRSSHHVRGMNPYRVGGDEAPRWGRSTFRYPVVLSTSYLIESKGVISMNAFTTEGLSGPASRPCQG